MPWPYEIPAMFYVTSVLISALPAEDKINFKENSSEASSKPESVSIMDNRTMQNEIYHSIIEQMTDMFGGHQ